MNTTPTENANPKQPIQTPPISDPGSNNPSIHQSNNPSLAMNTTPPENANPKQPIQTPPISDPGSNNPSIHQSNNPSLAAPAHRRNGKIAKLPKQFRDLVNQMLSDGVTYSAIIAKLAEDG